MITPSTPAADPPSVGDRLRNRRQELALSQRELAARASIPKSVISKLEARKISSSRYISRIAKALGVPAIYLTDGEQVETLGWRESNVQQMISSPPGNALGGSEVILLEVVHTGGAMSGGLPISFPVPRSLLPADRLRDLAVVSVRPSLHVVVDRKGPIVDGDTCALLWHSAVVLAKVYHLADGYRLVRDGVSSDVPMETFDRDLVSFGRVILSIQRHDL